MTAACKECGGNTEWHDDAGSNICTSCGTLTDASQTILTDPDYLIPTVASTILKSIRSQGHTLAGQGKEARDARNHYAMSEFINSLAVSINASGLSPRANVIFTQAMAAGCFRWGRKAKLVAGASLVVALREYRRPDTISDIAYLLDVQCSTLVRTLTSIISLLNLSLTPVDPSIHVTPLLTHLTSLLASEPAPLPAPLMSQLKAMSIRTAANTATSLCTLLARLGPDHQLNALPSPPTAVAIFLLALEAESRAPLARLGELSQALGASCNRTSRGVVMARYKLVQDEICAWVEQVPWLAKYEQRTTHGKTRAIIGKRLIVARGIADVLQFQDEIWRGKLRPTVLLEMGDDKDDDEDLDAEAPVSSTTTNITTTSTTTHPLIHDLTSILSTRPPKRQKIAHHPLRDATQFLLNPLAGPLPDCESPPEPLLPQPHNRIHPQPQPQTQNTAPPDSPPPFQANAHHARSTTQLRLQPSSSLLLPRLPSPSPSPQPTPTSSLPPVSATPAPPAPKPTQKHRSRSSLPAYILTIPSPSLLNARAPPTRLQLLSAARGASAISDNDLFGDGELEGLLRTPGEAREEGRRLVGLGIWDLDEGGSDEEEGGRRKRKNKGGKKGKGKWRAGEEDKDGDEPRKSRVDLDALARFLDDGALDEGDGDDAYDAALLGLEHFPSHDDDEDEEGDEGSSDVEEWSAAAAAVLKGAVARRAAKMDEGEVVLEEWRPASPGAGGYGGGYGGYTYEEEYD